MMLWLEYTIMVLWIQGNRKVQTVKINVLHFCLLQKPSGNNKEAYRTKMAMKDKTEKRVEKTRYSVQNYRVLVVPTLLRVARVLTQGSEP